MKLSLPGGRVIELAREKAPAKVDGQEQGSAGSTAAGYFQNELTLNGVRNPTIKQIMDMIDNDGTAAALYNVMAFPVMASDWHMEPHPLDVIKTTDAEGNVTESNPQAEFIEQALRNPEHMGGMSTPFSLVISDILLAVAQGYRFFEIVYKLNDQGMIVFKKVVARNQNDFTILEDDTGGFAGVEQNVKRGNQTIKVTIELPYCFMYTYKKERHKLRGASAFRAGFYHYDKKHRLYYLQNQQAQVNAMGLKVLEEPEDASDGTEGAKNRDTNLAAVDKMAVRPSIALPFGWKLNILQPSKGIDLGGYVDHQDVQMARAVLAQGMLLGNNGKSGGSYALAESHLDLFMLGEMALMSTIEEHITSYLISKLIDYNFDVKHYPTFKFNALNDSDSQLLREAFKGLISKGAVPVWVAEAISDRVTEQMQIEKPEDADESLVAASGRPTGAGDDSGTGSGRGGDRRSGGGSDDDDAEAELSRTRKKKASLAKGDWWRELTATEAKVQFAKIQESANAAQDKMAADIKPVFDKLKDDTTTRLKAILTGDDITAAMDGFSLNYAEDLRKAMNAGMVDQYSVAKTQAADEIKKAAPANQQASKDLMGQHVTSIVDKQYSDLLFSIKTVVTDAVRKNLLAKTELSVGDILKKVLPVFDDFYTDKELLTITSLITIAINIGRDDVFQKYESDIYGYQYSAILDDVVCKVCEELDASVATEADYYSTKWMPPIHFNCRCIWVAIMREEEDKPEFTGIPEAPGGTTEPSLSRETSMVTLWLSRRESKALAKT